MSEPETLEARTAKKLQQELDQFHDDPVRLAQAQLDRFWQAKLDAAAEQRRMMQALNPTGLKIW